LCGAIDVLVHIGLINAEAAESSCTSFLGIQIVTSTVDTATETTSRITDTIVTVATTT
jgi:hypothetical protein